MRLSFPPRVPHARTQGRCGGCERLAAKVCVGLGRAACTGTCATDSLCQAAEQVVPNAKHAVDDVLVRVQRGETERRHMLQGRRQQSTQGGCYWPAQPVITWPPPHHWRLGGGCFW